MASCEWHREGQQRRAGHRPLTSQRSALCLGAALLAVLPLVHMIASVCRSSEWPVGMGSGRRLTNQRWVHAGQRQSHSQRCVFALNGNPRGRLLSRAHSHKCRPLDPRGCIYESRWLQRWTMDAQAHQKHQLDPEREAEEGVREGCAPGQHLTCPNASPHTTTHIFPHMGLSAQQRIFAMRHD